MTNRAEQMYGRGLDALGSSGGLAATPWPTAGSRKDRRDFDPELVNQAIRNGQEPEPLDPRDLRTRQPHLRKDIVAHYMTSSEVFADKNQAGNQTPVVYEREPLHPTAQPERILLSGNHRAAAALLRGEQFNAIRVKGPYGPPR